MSSFVFSSWAVALVTAFVFCFSVPVHANEASRDQATVIFEKARADQIEIKAAISAVAKLPDADQDPVVLSIHGSLLSMRASQARLPFRRLKFVNEGLDLLDEAAAGIDPEKPGYLQVYMTAAITNASVPGFLGRKDFADRYFRSVAAHPNFDKMEASDRATVFAWRAKLVGSATSAGARFAEQARKIDPATADEILSDS